VADGRRIALVLEYDGSRYGGFQRQRNAPTVQGELERALAQLTGATPRLAFAGRTDAGTHALGQVAAFTTTSRLTTDAFLRGLNALLSDDIAVRAAREVPASFDPRRDAERRSYRYVIYQAAVRSPLWRTRAWHVRQPLDLDAMRAAAASLVGEHDFAAFSRREPTTTVRTVYRCELSRRGAFVCLEMEANAFLRHQVRRTVGALVQVGVGRLSVEGFCELLRRAEPASAGPVAPAHGLYLVRVTYPGLDLERPDTL
jgi:tRNA pseudouridine38-40 synthase